MAHPESMQPCRCPTCQQDLVITCPNRCRNAADGAGAHAQRGPNRRNSQTRDAVLQALKVRPGTAREIAHRLGQPIERVAVVLSYLRARGLIRAELPPGRKSGAIFGMGRAA